jgi:hypothetical protein
MRILLSLVAVPVLLFLAILLLFLKDDEYDPYPENKTSIKKERHK